MEGELITIDGPDSVYKKDEKKVTVYRGVKKLLCIVNAASKSNLFSFGNIVVRITKNEKKSTIAENITASAH